MMKSGVYKISCGRRFYIGSTSDFRRRWRDHQNKLRGGYHSNQYMQNLYNKTGGKGFEYEILIGCVPDQRLKFEQELIDHHWGDKNCMNLSPSATNQYLSEATKKKIRESCKGVNKGQTWSRGAGNGRAKAITVVFTDGTTKDYPYMQLLADELGVRGASVGRWLNGWRTPSKKWGIKEIRHAGV